MILCIGHFPRARTAAATGAGPQSRAAHESPPQTAPRPRAATPVAARPAPQTPSFLCNGPVVRGAAAHDGRNAARASGRDGPFQLRIKAGNSACVLTEGIGAFEVWLCSTPHHEPCEAI